MTINILFLLLIDCIGYVIRIKNDKDFQLANTRLYPFMWLFYRK